MDHIQRLIDSLRREIQTNPGAKNFLELLVALGAEILRTDDEETNRFSSEDSPQSESARFSSQHAKFSSLRKDVSVSHEKSSEQEDTEDSEQTLTPADLQRLIAHFRSKKMADDPHQPYQTETTRKKVRFSLQIVPAAEQDVAPTEEPPLDIDLLTTRTQLKAEVSRWCAERLRGSIPSDAETRYYRMAIQRAKALPECYLWMLDYQGSPGLLDYVADCYEALCDVAELLPMIPKTRRRYQWAEQLLELSATIQSALHNVLQEAGLDVRRYPDPDQDMVFSWLKWYTRTYQRFIPRHMELRDPADFTQIAHVREELDRLRQEIPPPSTTETSVAVSLEAKKHLRTLRYHVGHILRESVDPEHHWRRIRQEIDAIIGLGVPPSNVELRTILLPVVEEIPTDDEYLSPAMRLVLREIDRYLARQELSTPREVEITPSEELQLVRTVLQGKVAVLIGGDERPHTRQAIERALGLRELIWISTRPHESLDVFLPYIKRETVALVMLAVRWASHSYTEIATLCKQYRKPFVRLPGGYNPNQIAAQIIAQAGTQLGIEAPAAGLEPATL
ncbi:MAG: hypothetical protein RMK00_05725 [Bacteroidota bacterium]|nr:hypothetical protein [Bacteroidota bacterium]